MIHDILLCLLCPAVDHLQISDFLISNFSDDFLHPLEKNILQKIINLANKYREIRKFILKYGSSQQQQGINNHSFKSINGGNSNSITGGIITDDFEEPLQKGLYLQSFADGIDLVLQEFRDTIVNVEERFLKTPTFSILFVYQQVQCYESIFVFLQQTLINGVKSQRLHGCALLQFLQKHSLHGNDKIFKAIRIIQKSIHVVLLKQLSQWLLYGNFVDVYGEFFIQHIEQQQQQQQQQQQHNKHCSQSSISGGVAGGGGSKYGEQNTTATSISSTTNRTTHSVTNINMATMPTNTGTTTTTTSDATSINTDLWRYEISYQSLPQYISINLAEKILFIGQTVVMFNSDPNAELMKKTNLWNKQMYDDDVVDSLKRNGSLTLWNNQEESEYFKRFQQLQDNCNVTILNSSHLENIINDLKHCVTERLSEIAINQADLMKQLKLIKDFYLLGRGELFLEFLKQLNAIQLTNSISSITSAPIKSQFDDNLVRDITKSFQNAANCINLTDDLEQFTLHLSIDDHQHHHTGDSNITTVNNIITYSNNNFINDLSLLYKVNWPLHLLFSPMVIERYNEMFRFLLKIKKIQYDLQMIWCQHREQKIMKNSRVLQFRNKLMFVIDNLQYYLQVDVLEGQFSILANTVQTSKDFEHIQRAHTLFQANVLGLCFLLPINFGNGNNNNSNNNKNNNNNNGRNGNENQSNSIENPVLIILNKIMQRVIQFCELNRKCNADNYSKRDWIEFETCETLFSEHIDELLKLLTGLKAGPSSVPLSQFLLRLDFNYWFSSQEAH